MEKEIEVLQAENIKLSNLISYFKTDTYKEKEARRLLGYQKPGEKVIIIPEIEEEIQENDQPSEQTEEIKKDTQKNYQKWWDFFFVKIE